MSINGRTHAVREHQRAVIEKALLAGKRVADVVAAAVASFGVTETTARSDVEAVKKRWHDDRRLELEAEFGKALLRRELLYYRAIEKDDLDLALRVEQDRCELLGLYPKKTVVLVPVAVPAGAPDAITDEELCQIAGDVPVAAAPPAASAPSPHHFDGR